MSIFQVEQEAYNDSSKIDSFEHFDLNPKLIDVLDRYSITRPLKIQINGIPKILNGANTVITAETGCGKTLTYLLPMIHKILTWKTLKDRTYNTPLGLIVTPTRELAFQIGVCIIHPLYYPSETDCVCTYIFEKHIFYS